ncbi:sialidase family protein [Calothrix sp. PCC 7507]|uniref:WD40/YVTN/BNR-like repeat-containing protein n=1 Tax=Calothrix sp. PCC 7507 TaxID=99598 RepID=UPI00029F0645|nr:sialidase family protein [Calothrix sp. PCC 7507]AFY32698.1 carbohydrate-binding protein [Calothrix sp. PCC 7507]
MSTKFRLNRFSRAALVAIASFALTQSAYIPVPVPRVDTINSAVASVADETSAPYSWGNVAINGMGFVTGLVIHPAAPDLIYARTDVGGVFRWDATASQWIPLMDGFGRDQKHYYSIESIALDPKNPDVIYAAVGGYTQEANGEILKSSDRGITWIATGLRTPTGEHVRMGGNENWRWVGERLAVDPNNSQVIYFGSRLDGLYQSSDGAVSWKKVTSFPATGTANGGLAFVLFDPQTTKTYVGVIGGGVYSSKNGGANWQLLKDDPGVNQNPQQAAIAKDGTLYIAFFTSSDTPQGEVWKYANNQWIQITPESNKNYTSVTIDPNNPDIVMVAEYPLSSSGMYRSINGGKNWDRVRLDVKAERWWPSWHLHTLMGRLVINPHNPKQVWLTTGFGVMRTDDITVSPSNWVTYMSNLEELVTFVVKSPPLVGGAALLSGIADMDGFRHLSITNIPSQTYERGKFADTTGMDFSEANPFIVVRVGSSPGVGGREDSQVRGAYSSDNGQNWRPFSVPPTGAVNGKVAVSATLQPNGYPIIVWAPQGNVYPHRSLDGGQTWLSVTGAPNGTISQLWFPSQAVASDRVDGNVFYLYKYDDDKNKTYGGTFYRSVDGGATWKPTVTNLPNDHLHYVKAVPGMRGHVWLSVYGNSLYRSGDGGQSFTRLANVQRADELTFGKPASGRTNSTVFVYGVVNQTEGLFRSDDATSLPGDAAGATWMKVSTANQAFGNVTYLEGDRLKFGGIYVGTGGRGIFYGQPNLKIYSPR